MNNNIDEELEKLVANEIILYKGEAHVSKTSNQLFRFLLMLLFLLIFWYLVLKIPSDKAILMKTIFVLVLTIFSFLGLYGILYNLFLKYQNKNNKYYVTNQNIIKYNSKTNFVIRKIKNIEVIQIARIKDNYADLIFTFADKSLLEKMKNTLTFEGVENFKDLIDVIVKYNKSINVVDDRIEIMGKKINN